MNQLIRVVFSLARGRKLSDPRVWIPVVLVVLAVGGPAILDSVSGNSSDDTTSVVRQADSSADRRDEASERSERPDGGDDNSPTGDKRSGLGSISVDDLPIEATDTLVLIDAGGPYPFDKDSTTFQNREGLLPDESMGWYREFTVITPGESTRGARRIVAGDAGELYWTDDHYESFSEIIDW